MTMCGALLVVAVMFLAHPQCTTPRYHDGSTAGTATSAVPEQNTADGCDELRHACTRRCCSRGERFATLDNCTPVDQDEDVFLPVLHRWPDLAEVRAEDYPPFGAFRGDPCSGHKLLLEPAVNSNYTYFLLEDGRLFVRNLFDQPLNTSEFCVEPLGADRNLTAFFCSPANDTEKPLVKHVAIVYPLTMILSLPFLIATFLVYTIVPRLNNFHGKVLRCYIGCLFFVYVFLALMQLQVYDIGSTACIVTAFIIYFSFLASFFWLNVMCFDIWWTFSGFRPLRGSEKERDHKKFIIYSIYAWGSSMLLLLVCLLMDLLPGISEHVIVPEIGKERCWFCSRAAEASYFYGPMAVIVVCNVILFVLTALRIVKLKQETAMLKGEESRRHDVEENKQRFVLYLKLFVVMGVNWGMEVISFVAGGPEYLWYITDIGNTLQGVLIFLIFVWKEKIRRLLAKRLCPRLTRGSVRTGSSKVRGTLSRSVATPTSSFSLTTKATTNGELSRMARDESDVV